MTSRKYPHMVRRVVIGDTRFYQSHGNANRVTTKVADTAWFPGGCDRAVTYADVDGVMVRLDAKPVMRVLADVSPTVLVPIQRAD